ncbi:glycosyltransferase family 2 protein [Arthrobacter sp. AK01]|uniref:glycosyltransferase family 2 protein n=1 Tax=Micrococcaceae TaxID=1268 RepID=UPI001E50A6B2|nr:MULTISPECIES: glycosyltransferase family 2 protein [Micrococcaceae]MCD4853390.1 glycosyltransferase family 2 protein [Arthrobacter sp. AK01]MCP1410774.1 cellulose synthase/poly-beta-1,6-N-acetylglucosamine synthase-like glycosyltransferase [Paenarthrobacter sp. A20]
MLTEITELTADTAATDTAAAPRGSHRAAGGVVTVLVPAHNESAGITETLTSLNNQTRRPDRIIVVADNCTDDTETLALAQGVEVMRTVGNKDKKAGALNFALSELLPDADPEDLVLVQDADSQLALDFIENATKNLLTDELLGAVGGVFSGGPGGGFVGHLQRNEYARYARDVKRLHGKCLVVTGTAALFRVKTLRDVVAARLEGTLPPGNGKGGVYDTSVLTEDNELSFALLTLGYRIASPSNCTLVTEVMPTWRELWAQRLRWKRGAVENCVQYGWTKITRPYWGRQFLSMIGVIVTLAYFGSIIFALTTGMGLNLHPFWIAVTGIFVLERIVTVRFRGWRYMLLAATMYETVIDIFLQAVHAKAYLDAALNRKKVW